MVAPSAESPAPSSAAPLAPPRRLRTRPRAARALAALLALGLAACGGGSKGKAPAVATAPDGAFAGGGGQLEGEPSGAAQEAPAQDAPAPRSATAPGTGASGAPIERAEKKAEALADEDARDASRRGLGTGFGETRRSRVHDVTFLRDAERPFTLLSVRYDDARGAERLGAFATGAAARVLDDDGLVRLTVEDEAGRPLEGRRAAGGRAVVVGEEGQRYVLALENRSDHRLEAVVTVDGLDVVSGQPGSFAARGYVLMPFQTTRIDGFRRSHDHVAAFRFARTSESYAAQTGSPRNVGVIGVALFAERGDAFDREARLRATASPFPDEPGFARAPRR